MENKEFYKENKDLFKARSLFRQTADIIDDLIILKEKEYRGEEVSKELEDIKSQLTIKSIEMFILNSLF